MRKIKKSKTKMRKFINNILFKIYLTFHSVMVRTSIALHTVENDILKADPNNLQESDKKIIRNLHRNQVLEKFYAGKGDERYTQDYYSILSKADKFLKTATPHDMAVAADKRGTSFGMKDIYGRRYEHYGFFDATHKNAGKTMGEVLVSEMDERRTKDDEYELLNIYNNVPIEVGFAKVFDVIEKTEKENVDFEYEVVDIFRKSQQFEFPIKAIRENENTPNKIEQLTEFLHVKKIGFEYRQLEFFIPLKFKTVDLDETSEIFKEIVNIKNIYVKDDFGKIKGYGIIEYTKRINHNDTHEVLKFKAIEMETVQL